MYKKLGLFLRVNSFIPRIIAIGRMVQNSSVPQPPAATLINLEKPEKLQTLLKQEKVGDCLSCKLVGKSPYASYVCLDEFQLK